MAAPKRELFKAADVCEVVQVQPYVLRSWEAEFPQIGQVPAGGGPRLYRRSDVELVLRIKQLVFDEGLTLSGARRRLDEDGEGPDSGAAAMLVEEVVGDRVLDRLRHVKTGLQSILQMLSKDGVEAAELQLVPPPAPAEAKKKTVAKAAKRK
ncbi:MAG: MerR family transcriptional regulator [Acidobacteriota bacterium]|nr:MerR family transcriptional regulator [Acidobacteriota bacterium]